MPIVLNEASRPGALRRDFLKTAKETHSPDSSGKLAETEPIYEYRGPKAPCNFLVSANRSVFLRTNPVHFPPHFIYGEFFRKTSDSPSPLFFYAPLQYAAPAVRPAEREGRGKLSVAAGKRLFGGAPYGRRAPPVSPGASAELNDFIFLLTKFLKERV